MLKRAISSLALVFVVVFAFLNPNYAQAQQEEMLGQQAEKAGKLREALAQYVAALQKTAEGSADDQRLRETIMKLVQKLSPPPAVPDEAKRFSVRGQIAIKEAKSPADFDEAAKEFGRALRVAPWWADGYINQGVALEKAGKYTEAIRSLKFYLLAAPGAPDAEKIKEQIYALEYRQEKAGKEAVAKREEQERKRREEEAKASDPVRIAGEWCGLEEGHLCRVGTQITVKGTNFEIVGQRGHLGNNYEFRFSGTIQGDELTGSFYTYFSGGNCPTPPFPFIGRITSGGNRIELSYTRIDRYNMPCTVTSTQPVRSVLVRKSSY